MPHLLIFVLLVALPFLVLPFGASHFEVPKVIAAEILIEVLLFYTLLKGNIFKNVRRVHLFACLLLLSLTVFDLLFRRTPTTLFGNPFRLQGVFLLWHLIFLSFLSGSYPLGVLKTKWAIAPLVFLGLGVLSFGTNPAGRAVGTLGEPNFLAACAVFLWPFTLGAKKRLSVLAAVLAAAIIIASGSRSGLIALGLQLVFLILSLWFKKPLKLNLAICFLLLICSLVLPFTTATKIYEDRGEIWQTAWQAGVRSPLIGNGFGNLEQTLKGESIRLYNNVHFQYVDSAHNLLLDYFASGGLVGVGILLVLVARGFRSFLEQKNIREISLLLGVLAVMLFNPTSITTLIAFWWLLGQGAKDKKSP